jgi:hypothetical protein
MYVKYKNIKNGMDFKLIKPIWDKNYVGKFFPPHNFKFVKEYSYGEITVYVFEDNKGIQIEFNTDYNEDWKEYLIPSGA